MRKIIYLFVAISIFFSLVNIGFLLSVPQIAHVTGNIFASVAGTISLVVLAPDVNVYVHSPENTTYNFSIGSNYTINLSVSSDSSLENWWYSLYDERHDEYVVENVLFTPNTTFNATRWENRIEVYANDSSGNVGNTNVSFFVSVPNSSPIIYDLDSEVLVCEGSSLSNNFTASDIDEDSLNVDISPKNPFYIDTNLTSAGNVNTTIEIFSGVLTKEDVGLHEETVSVDDGDLSDNAEVNVTVIEINNAPNLSSIGVQTIWTEGENSSKIVQVNVNDTEDGTHLSENLTFNLTFSSGDAFFTINSTGAMNITGNSSLVGVYNLSLCVTDLGISNPHQNISICGQDGTNQTSCKNFSVTVTDENRAPEIDNYTPSDLTPSVSGNSALTFNITDSDPDGTTPDTYWYVDGSFVEFDSGSSEDSFTYTFECGVSGVHTVSAEVSDGELNSSLQWNVTVSEVSCFTNAGGVLTCTGRYGCGDWEVCQNSLRSLEIGIISDEDYSLIKEECDLRGLDERYCGFQLRSCVDVNSCGDNVPKTIDIGQCYYIPNPSCSDGIENCHDGLCEVLVDCGGPCGACSTCSDGVQNQGEFGVDCGGPCPFSCEEENPFTYLRPSLQQIVGGLAILGVIIFFLVKIMPSFLRVLMGTAKKR